MTVCNATLHRAYGALDLGSFSSPLLAKHCEKNDSSPNRYVVGDAEGIALRTKIEPQLSELSRESSSARFAEMHPKFGKPIDRGLHATQPIVG